MNRSDTEKNPAVFVGKGIVLSSKLAASVQNDWVEGAYVIDISKPYKCKFYAFGAGGRFIPTGISMCKYKVISRTQAELYAMSDFFLKVDPENKLRLMASMYFIDFAASGAVLERAPTDEEIVRLHLRYRGRVMSDRGFEREMRALDRRRYVEGGLEPPEERKKAMGDGLWRGPSTKRAVEGYLSGGEEEDEPTSRYSLSRVQKAAAPLERMLTRLQTRDHKRIRLALDTLECEDEEEQDGYVEDEEEEEHSDVDEAEPDGGGGILEVEDCLKN